MLRDGESLRAQKQQQEQAMLKRMAADADALAARNRAPQMIEQKQMLLNDSRQRLRDDLAANGRRMGVI